jgi:hypothetical protein
MRVLLFITSYRQLDEFYYFNLFLQHQTELSSISSIYIYEDESTT